MATLNTDSLFEDQPQGLNVDVLFEPDLPAVPQPDPVVFNNKPDKPDSGRLHQQTVNNEVMQDNTSFFLDSVKDTIAEDFGQADWQSGWDRVIQPVTWPVRVGYKMAAVPVGLAEVGLSFLTDLAGAGFGTVGSVMAATAADLKEKGVENPLVSATMPARVMTGLENPMERIANSSLMEILPETVTEWRSKFAYEPRTDSGKALMGMLTTVFEKVSELGDFLGGHGTEAMVALRGAETEDKAQQAAALGTALRILPESLLMLLPLSKGKAAASNVADAWARAQRAKADGLVGSVFDPKHLDSFPIGLTPKEAMRKAEVKEALDKLKNQPPTEAIDKVAIQELTKEYEALRQKEIVKTESEMLTTMNPDELMGMVGDKQLEGLKDADIVAALENKGKPVVVNRGDTGTIIESGLEELVVAKALGFENVPVRVRVKEMNPTTVENLASQTRKVYDANRRAMEELAKRTNPGLFSKGMTAWIDRQYELKKKIVQAGGDSGRAVVMRMELMAGSNTAGRLMLDNYKKRVYKGLSEEQIKNLDDLIDARRGQVVEQFRMAKAKEKGTEYKPMNRKGKLQLPHFEAMLRDMRNKLGEHEYNLLYSRAAEYFTAMDELLQFRRDEGLISQAEYDAMSGLDYRTTKYLDIQPDFEKLSGKTVSVGESGINPLGQGANRFIDMSSQHMLELNTLAVYRKVFENRANKELARMAEEVPDNPLVRKISGKEGKKQNEHVLEYLDAGKKKKLAVDPIFAEQWKFLDADMKRGLKSLLNWTSGQRIVKESAVGLNPFFWITDFPRAVVHAYAAAGKSYMGNPIYSAFPPGFLSQLGVDLATVAKDAATHGPRYQAWVKEGGAPGFLAHLGGADVTRLPKPMQPIARGLSWMNEYSEAVMRLAIRERALKNGLSEVEATHASRAFLDYAKSGPVSHFIDQFSPFFNPSMQAFATGLKGLKDSPERAAWAAITTAGVTGMLYAHNYFNNPEAMDQVSDVHMFRGLNYPIPGFEFLDTENRTIYPYIHVPMENWMMPVIGMTNFIMAKHFGGRTPDPATYEVLTQMAPITPTSFLPPTMDAGIAMFMNKDTFTNQDIWKGDPVQRYAEVYGEEKANATPRPYQWLAESLFDSTGLDLISPARMDVAVSGLLANHPFLTASKMNLTELWGDTPRNIAMMSNREFLLRNPPFRRVIKMGTPTARAFEAGNAVDRVENTRRMKMDQKVDLMMDQVRTGDSSVENVIKTIEAMNTGVDPLTHVNDVSRLTNRAINTYMLDQAFDGLNADSMKRVPRKSWWLSLSNDDPLTRARRFYNWWKIVGPGDRRSMERLSRRLNRFFTPEFHLEFQQLKAQEGVEQE